MAKSFIGKFGRNAREEFARKIHRARLSGDLKISPKMEKQIDERFTKVFTKNGKIPISVKERDIEKEVLNPLRLGRNDYFTSKNVDIVDKKFGFSDHTKQIGGKYAFALQQEKKAALQKRFEDLKKEKEQRIIVKEVPEFKKAQKSEVSAKTSEPKITPEILNYEEKRDKELRIRAEERLAKIQEMRKTAEAAKYNESSESSSEKGAGRNNLSERRAPNAEPDRNVPREAPKYDQLPPRHTDSFKPPVD